MSKREKRLKRETEAAGKVYTRPARKRRTARRTAKRANEGDLNR